MPAWISDISSTVTTGAVAQAVIELAKVTISCES
jgi:hypothetical protein